MAKVTSAWGIDIGQCALKAIRCHVDPKDRTKIVADAFDYIEYPKILSQPEADPVELVREALDQFLSRNDLSGKKVSVSVSGQSGLARFIKLPPVETKKIPDIVRYEANQQIPFELDEVIWDYQRMFGGGEEEGFAMETEVGLFAMKRDQVYQEIEPYLDASIDVDIVQLTPLSIYNFVVFDQLHDLPPEDEFDPDDPPESIVVLSIGTESTDLVITNGFRVWQRSVPLGGSHFTKALVKELQLTYAKAEHLKRNATQAEDPKALYQAMRPIFKELLTEIQRSIGYFHSIDRTAKIGRVVALGNSIKLPGLKRYLSQNLETEVEEIAAFKTLSGGAATQSPAFKENVPAYGVAYGLSLQALGAGRLSTNLVPQEIVRDRIINRKKPWAVAATVLLALGCLVNFLLLWWPWYQVRIEEDSQWKSAIQANVGVQQRVTNLSQAYETADQAFKARVSDGNQLLAHFDRRTNWLNLFVALDKCVPSRALNVDDVPEGVKMQNLTPAQRWMLRDVMWITDMRSQKYEDLGQWYTSALEQKFQEYNTVVRLGPPPDAEQPEESAGAQLVGDAAMGTEAGPTEIVLNPPQASFLSQGRPSGPGWVIQLVGFHFHDSERHASGPHFVRRTLLYNLMNEVVQVPDGEGNVIEATVRDLGISHPLLFETREVKEVQIPDTGSEEGQTLKIKQRNFVVQFAYAPQPISGGSAPRIAQLGQPDLNN